MVLIILHSKYFLLSYTAKNECPDLDPPGNGGTVCVAEVTTNTERCEVKCNPGYEHSLRNNEFEECGPSTNWRWSYEVSETPLLDCVGKWWVVFKTSSIDNSQNMTPVVVKKNIMFCS